MNIGDIVIYKEETYEIIDTTLDGNYIIGRENNCETEVNKNEIRLK